MRYIVFLFLVIYSLIVYGQSNPKKYAATISESDLKRHLEILASDEYEGRETGRKGQKMAAEYISNYFSSINVPGGNGGEYYQKFPLILQHSGATDIKINTKKYSFLDDFYFYKGFKDTTFSTDEIVFVGYGIDDKKYSDYKGVNVVGKVVMVLAGEPIKKGKSVITKSKEVSPWSVNWRYKMEAAKKTELKLF